MGATMKKMRVLLKKALTSVTIMVIPHDSLKALNLKIPMVGLIVTILFAVIGGGYTLSLAVSGLKYKSQHSAMVEKVKFYSGQFYQWDSTVAGLKMVEMQFRRLFSLQSKEAVLENADTAPIGSLELPNLIAELKKTIETVDEIKEYLRVQKDIYVATPKGYPAVGEITCEIWEEAGSIQRRDGFSHRHRHLLRFQVSYQGYGGWSCESLWMDSRQRQCGDSGTRVRLLDGLRSQFN